MSISSADSWVVLSPHHDDAALSLGLTLIEASHAGVSLNILNAFTVSDYAPRSDAEGVTDVSRVRASEDSAFVAQLPGAVAGDLGRRDAPLRGYRGYGFIRRSAFGEDERAEVLDLALQLRRWSGHDVYYVPLSVGDHIDHRVARAAAERAWSGAELRYYEDLPYGALKPGQLRAKLETLGPEPRAATGGGSRSPEGKQPLIACYASQLTMEQQHSVIAHAKLHHGERWWCRAD